MYPSHGDLIAKEAPGALGGHGFGKGLLKEGFFPGRHHGPVGGTEHLAAEALDVLRRALRGEVGAVVDLLRTPRVAGLQGDEAGQIAEAEVAPVICARFRGGGVAEGHPFIVGLERGVPARLPGAFSVGLVVLRAAHPGIVRRFVVIPDHNEGVGRMHEEAAGVALVLAVALAIVPQGHDFLGRHVSPAQGRAGASTVAVRPILVKVIAKVEDKVHLLVSSDGVVAIEVPEGVVRTGGNGQRQLIHGAPGEGPGATDHGDRITREEPIVVGVARGEPRRQHLDREVPLRPGVLGAAQDRALEGRIFCELPAHRGDPGAWLKPGPEHHGVFRGIAAGDPMTKYPLRLLGGGEAPGTPPGEESSGSEALHKGPSGKG